MAQNKMEETIIHIFDRNADQFRQTLIQLYKNTHLIGAQDDNYEWCMVLTRKGQLKIYEQLKFAYEVKSNQSEILEYEYEILGQEYVNILDVKNYTKDIINRLNELGAIQHFVDWYNKEHSQTLSVPDALRFQKAEQLLFLLKEWNPHIFKEIENHIYSLNAEKDMLLWLAKKINIVESTINQLRQQIKYSV